MLLDELLDDTFPWRHDVDGRPLAEGAAPAHKAAPTELVRCPFSGSRAGEPMNRTAWGQVARHGDAADAMLAAGSGPTAADAWLCTSRLRWRGLFHSEPVPRSVAIGYKLALGLQRPLTSWLLLTPGAADRPLEELMAPDEVFARLEAEGWLHGATQVCPAPPARIEAAWRSLCGATGQYEAVEPDMVGAERATALVVGAWAVLGATREVLRAGRLHELPNTWRLGTPPPLDGPEVLTLLLRRGPTALVREVPRFEPEWALHVYGEERAPAAVAAAVSEARSAVGEPEPFWALDQVWSKLKAAAPRGGARRWTAAPRSPPVR